MIFRCYKTLFSGLGISVGIATGYGLDGPGIQSLKRSWKRYKKRLYGVLITMAVNEREIPEMRVISKYPAIQWEIIWKNIHHTAIPEPIKSTWYAVVHEIIPTSEHLADIHKADTDRCPRCNELDSLSRIGSWNAGMGTQFGSGQDWKSHKYSEPLRHTYLRNGHYGQHSRSGRCQDR
jgi:hypothetical protein